MRPTTFLGLITIALLTFSCVGKKKFEAALAKNELDSQGFENRISILDREILQKKRQIDTLSLRYAETRGANGALLATQDKHLDRIDEVQAQLDNARKDKSSTAQDLTSEVRDRDQTIKDKTNQLARISGTIDKFEKENEAKIGNLRWELEQAFAEKQSVEYVNQELRIILNDELLFRSNNARVRTAGIQNLKKIADFMNSNPTLRLYVIGNTDNKKAKNYKDNWDYSVIKASNVVKVLTGEHGLSPSRVIAAGKGEFSPKASNETTDGKTANRRIEFIIIPRLDRLVKDLKKIAIGEE